MAVPSASEGAGRDWADEAEEHIIEMAKALVKVKDEKIEVLTEPMIRHCPLRNDLYGCEEESQETVEKS